MRVPLAYPINLPLLEIPAGEGEAGAFDFLFTYTK